MPSRAELEQQCLVILDRFMEALNAYDVTGMEAAMHFPHVRIANGKVVVYPEPGHNPLDLFQHLQAEDGWQYSAWNAREIVQYSDTKVHMAVEYTRYRGDDSVIGVLYVAVYCDPTRWTVGYPGAVEFRAVGADRHRGWCA